MIGSILPRPIALISTISKNGIPNLAPFSFFNGITAQPPTVCFAPARKGSDGSKKDTLRNIEDTGEFVINIVSASIAGKMNEAAIEFPYECNEFKEVGLSESASERVKPPRVAESKINLECKLWQIIEIGPARPGGGFLVIGEIILFHIADELFKDGRIDTTRLDPVARLSGLEYSKLGQRFSLPRKPYQSDQEKPL